MGHADTRITERVYARVKQEHVGDRMLEALDPKYARAAQKGKKPARVKTVTEIPEPKVPTLYRVKGVDKTLSEWAQHAGIPKNTLWSRLQAGLTMPEAIAKGPSHRAGKLPGNSGTKRSRLALAEDDSGEPKTSEIRVRRGGIEPPTRGFSVPCSTD